MSAILFGGVLADVCTGFMAHEEREREGDKRVSLAIQ